MKEPRKVAKLKGWATALPLTGALTILCAGAADAAPGAAPGAGSGNLLQGKELQAAMQADKANAKRIAHDNGVDWCQTFQVYERRYGNSLNRANACPPVGDCDVPSNRDGAIPDPSDPPMVVRLKFNVFAMDDGSNPAATLQDVADQVDQLNNDYAPSRIQFEYETETINNTAYRFWVESEEGGMKNTYADRPDEMLNIYVVSINAGFIGVGTFPWDDVALGPMGGIVIHDQTFGAGEKTLTHEVGHCLGLWHTHHGVDEVFSCGICYETPNSAEGDVTGDYCADTDPTPTNFNCSGPGGNDPCSGQLWGATDPQNYMGYAPDFCYTEFSPQQMGRMHCWTDAVLSSWQSGVSFVGDTTFGPIPLDVQFTAQTNKIVSSWTWDFGDSSGASIQSPAHLYATPGVRDVQVSIQSTQGDYAQLRREYIAAYADTMNGTETQGSAGESVQFLVKAINKIPLAQLEVPFAWGGPLNLVFDSISTAGLRTSYMEIQGLNDFDPFNKRATYTMSADVIGGTPALAPGTGPVLSIWFTIPSGAGSGANPIDFPSYGTNSPTFVYGSFSYSPVLNTANVSICAMAGDADGSGTINIGDATYLIQRIFDNGPAPIPPNAGDANCDGSINISDVTFLISHIFKAGPAPCGCAP